MGLLYSLNSFRQRLFLRNFYLLSKNYRTPPPAFVIWDATKKCNLRCIHCSSEDTGVNELDLIEIMSILDQVAAAGVKRLQITGGEPLLREDLFRVIRYAAVKKFSVSLASNGYFIDQQKADILAKAGASVVQISLDGPVEIHNAIRGDESSFDRAVKAIKVLKKHPRLQVGVSTTVMPQNLTSLSDLKSILLSQQVNFWSIGIVLPSGKARLEPGLFLNAEQFNNLMGFIKNTRRILPIEFIENFPYLGQLDSQIRRSPKMCPAGILSCCIGVDGWLRGCPDQEDNTHYREGNLQQDNFTDIWQRAFRRYRNQEAVDSDSRCGQCTDLEKCRGGCWVMREEGLHCYREYLS